MTILRALVDLAPLVGAMLVLIGFSAFFSASEAALFSLKTPERERLKTGSRAQRTAHELLSDPDRLLSAVLFWNLVVNIVYFALASLIGLRLQKRPEVGNSGLLVFTFGSLLSIIFFSEMLPKSVAVLKARSLSALVSMPLSIAVRMVDPLMPALRLVNLLSRRLIWPSFQPEPYLEVTDLERAIEISTDNAALIDTERTVLRNLVLLSELRADECMRPRSQVVSFRPPVHWRDVSKTIPPSGYLLITEAESDQIVSALDLRSMSDFRDQRLDYLAQPVFYVPWCAVVGDVMQRMETQAGDVAAVVNELGETIGVLTRKDILELVFATRTSRSERLFKRQPIKSVNHELWQVTGITNLRTIEDFFNVPLPETTSVTVAGVIHEELQRLPVGGDQCQWGPFVFEIVRADDDGHIVVNLSRQDAPEATE